MDTPPFLLPAKLRWLVPLLPSAVAVALFAAASIAFIQSGSDLVNLAQPLAGALISFVIVATVCWEWKLLGNPKRAAPLIAHIALFLAVFFMINAMYAPSPDTTSLLGKLMDGTGWLAKNITGVPESVFNIIRAPSIALLFLGVCLALAVPRRAAAIGLLIAISGLAIFWALSQNNIQQPGWFYGGLAAMAAGITVLKRNFRLETFWHEVRKRLAGDRALRGDLELKIRLLRKMEELGRPLPPDECLGCVAKALALDESDPQVHTTTMRVAKQMVYQDSLAEISDHSGTKALSLNPALFAAEDGDDAWSQIARMPKVLIVLLIATLWILSPIDLIPDAVPVFGVIDDITVALLGFSMIRRRLPNQDARPGQLPKIGDTWP